MSVAKGLLTSDKLYGLPEIINRQERVIRTIQKQSTADHSMCTPLRNTCHEWVEGLPPRLILLWYIQINCRETLSRGVDPNQQPLSSVGSHLPELPNTERHRPGTVHPISGTTLNPSGYLSCLASTHSARVIRYRATTPDIELVSTCVC